MNAVDPLTDPIEMQTFGELRPTNPKDAIGSSKLSLGLVPDVLMAEAATAFLEGALKYGRFNWRIAGVRASIYNDALERHRMKWWNGDDRDPVTRVRHLANLAACVGILLDAELCGMLTDDRPPRAPLPARVDEHAATVAHLKDLFKDHAPKQFTIADSVHVGVDLGAPGGSRHMEFVIPRPDPSTAVPPEASNPAAVRAAANGPWPEVKS